MKKLIICFILALILVSCHSSKKAVKTQVDTASETKIEQATTSNYDAKLVNDIIAVLKMRITTREYFPPSGAPGADQDKGPLKSETTIEATEETKDKSNASVKKSEESQTSGENKESNTTKTEKKEKPAADPKRWMWIFFILALIAAGIFFLVKSPIWKTVKSVLSHAGKKLKI